MPNKPKMVQVNCKNCSLEFSTSFYNLKKGYGNFCSAKCRYAGFKETYECAYCKLSFLSTKARKNKSKTGVYFCSNACKHKAASCISNSYSTGPKEISKGESTYRNRALKFLYKKCFYCNYSEYLQLLDVDHIDGDRKNNDISNLQFLCVMCHALKTRLPNEFERIYGAKLNRNCKKCNTPLKINELFNCSSCLSKIANSYDRKPKTKATRPTKEDLHKLLWEMPTIKVAEKFGVSDKAIEKWSKAYKITKPPRGYWAKKISEK
jgi:hypothetical protein